MPNWCSTRYVCCGDPEEIQGLYDRMTRLAEMKEPLNPNGFGTTWLGNLVEDLGVDFHSVQCRGSWDGPFMHGDTMSFSTETAWYRCTEVEDLIKEKYPSVQIYFICEEPGMAIYEKNSSEHFPEDYVINYEGGDVYYLCEEEALEELSEVFGVDFQTIDEALVLVEEHNVSEGNENDNIWVHKFEIVD